MSSCIQRFFRANCFQCEKALIHFLFVNDLHNLKIVNNVILLVKIPFLEKSFEIINKCDEEMKKN